MRAAATRRDIEHVDTDSRELALRAFARAPQIRVAVQRHALRSPGLASASRPRNAATARDCADPRRMFAQSAASTRSPHAHALFLRRALRFVRTPRRRAMPRAAYRKKLVALRCACTKAHDTFLL
ncbi:hypothetical protein ACI2IY_20520 [Lysobacter enzymogenes]|uniref:hypothetical protein n=1 Tax=Lysobacter enzymogenes TaxID=69 RepID=UPI00384F91F7